MNAKPKVLMVGNFLSDTGANPTVNEALIRRLRDVGWNLITTSSKFTRISRLADMLITTWKHRHQYEIALVDVYSGPAFLWAEAVCLLLLILNKPYVLTLHGGNLPSFARRHSKRLARLLRRANAVTTPSEYLQFHLRDFRDDIRIIPNPLDISKYEFIQRKSVSPTLMWVRAFHNIYNPSLALEVVNRLKVQFQDVRLIMVGPDKQDGSLGAFRRMMAELGLDQSVEVLGGVPKAAVPTILQRGDIFINTTNVDNTPVSVLEALACGLCVVSTNVGGIPYLLTQEQEALLVPPDDPAAMADAISRLMSSPVLPGELSVNARKKAEQYDIKHTLRLWESLFNEVLCDELA